MDSEQQLRVRLHAHPNDFHGWVALLKCCEKVYEVCCVCVVDVCSDRALAAQHTYLQQSEVYDAFLGRFPLCYVYWKKYADMCVRNYDDQKAVEVWRTR